MRTSVYFLYCVVHVPLRVNTLECVTNRKDAFKFEFEIELLKHQVRSLDCDREFCLKLCPHVPAVSSWLVFVSVLFVANHGKLRLAHGTVSGVALS